MRDLSSKILDTQIADQITGHTVVKIIFREILITEDWVLRAYPGTKKEKKMQHEEWISLYSQENGYFISGLFKTKKIDKKTYDEIMSQCNGEEFDSCFCCNVKILNSKLGYNDFFNKYYNNF